MKSTKRGAGPETPPAARIGRAIALGLAAEGARVAVLARTENQLDAVVAEAKELGGDGIAIPVEAMDGPALKRRLLRHPRRPAADGRRRRVA